MMPVCKEKTISSLVLSIREKAVKTPLKKVMKERGLNVKRNHHTKK